MYARPLSEELQAPTGPPILLFTASAASWSKPLWFPDGVEPPEELHLAKDPLFTDGPFFVRSGNCTLHMLWSSFGAEGYAMGVASRQTVWSRALWPSTRHRGGRATAATE
jgi:hypothetical protein